MSLQFKLDLISQSLSGNKWFKLLLHIEDIKKIRRYFGIGGPYSNHLHALAAAGNKFNFKTIESSIGFVENPTINDLKKFEIDCLGWI